MKRSIVLMVAALALAAPARAQKSGESLWNVGAGVGFPVNGLDLSAFGGGNTRPGGMGVALAPQYLYLFSPQLGLGAELLYMNFPGRSVDLGGGTAAASGDLLAVEAVGRWLFYDRRGWSPYFTAGVGLGRYAVTVEQGPTTIVDAKTTSLTLFPGLGMKADLSDEFEASAELRWQAGAAGRAKFGTGVYDVLGLFVRLGWRR